MSKSERRRNRTVNSTGAMKGCEPTPVSTEQSAQEKRRAIIGEPYPASQAATPAPAVKPTETKPKGFSEMSDDDLAKALKKLQDEQAARDERRRAAEEAEAKRKREAEAEAKRQKEAEEREWEERIGKVVRKILSEKDADKAPATPTVAAKSTAPTGDKPNSNEAKPAPEKCEESSDGWPELVMVLSIPDEPCFERYPDATVVEAYRYRQIWGDRGLRYMLDIFDAKQAARGSRVTPVKIWYSPSYHVVIRELSDCEMEAYFG